MESEESLLLKIYNDIQKIIYECKYGQWFSDNKAYFDQFLNLSQGKLTADEYSDEFSRLQVRCALDEDDEHYVTFFTRGLRPSIRNYMKKECKDMYEAFWEAIRV